MLVWQRAHTLLPLWGGGGEGQLVLAVSSGRDERANALLPLPRGAREQEMRTAPVSSS